MTTQEMVEQACKEELNRRLTEYAEGMRLRGTLPDGSWYDVEIYDVEVTSRLSVDLEPSDEKR